MTPLRTGFVIAGLASFVLAIGFINQASWATDLWPWEATPLSYIFIASILVAIASPVLWIAVTGELAAMQAGAIDLAITYGGATIYLVTLAGDAGQPSLGPYIAVFGIGFLAMVITFVRSRSIPWQDHRPDAGPGAALVRRLRRDADRRRHRARLSGRHLPLGARRRDLGDVRAHLPRRRGLLHLGLPRPGVAERRRAS